ncbi:MAG: hypothetical protein Q9M28_05340 [Mariprofundaceae bacterium]|nr:hypothetical protein [Mariprofundaceae bacterium]
MFNSSYNSLANYTLLDAGDARQLSHKLEVLFKVIERHYLEIGHDFLENDERSIALQEEMKSYVKKMNEIKALPLSFRLRVMDQFQQHYASFFDSEYVDLALKSYEIASKLILSRLHEPDFRMALLEVSISTLMLSTRHLLYRLKHHQAVGAEHLSIAYDLVGQVFQILTYLEDEDKARVNEFKTCLCWYEFLLRMDFFSKDDTEQDQVIKVLDQYIEDVKVTFYEAGDVLPQQLDHDVHRLYLQVFPAYPELLPQLAMKFEKQETQVDVIVLELTSFFDCICMAATHKETNVEIQRGCELIRRTLLSRMRKDTRRASSDSDVILDVNIGKAFMNKLFSEVKHVHTGELPDTWSVLDYSRSGASLKSTTHTKRLEKLTIGHLVGLRWIGGLKDMGYQLGFVRWYKHSESEDMIGIEFFKLAYYMKTALRANKKKTIVLQERNDSHVVWLPHANVVVGEKFLLRRRDGTQKVSVKEVLSSGDNYSRVHMIASE